MGRFSFLSRRKWALAFILFCAVFFLILRSPFSRERDFTIPLYSLTDGKLYNWNNSISSIIYHPINVTNKETSFVYIATEFMRNDIYMEDLTRYNSFLARTLSTEYANHEISEDKTTFGCICGRVSDTCICCGVLIPRPTEHSLLTVDLYKAVILVPDGSKSAEATFCLNVTYLPQSRRIRTSAVLLHYNASLHTKSLQGYKALMNTTTAPTSIPIFNGLHLDILPLPIVCAGNPALSPTLDICTHFVSLEYKVKSDFGPKTSFIGCAYVKIVMSRRFVIARFPRFCFQAYQGAVADADSAENIRLGDENKSALSLNKTEPSLIIPNNIAPNKPPLNQLPAVNNPNAGAIEQPDSENVYPGGFDAHPVP